MPTDPALDEKALDAAHETAIRLYNKDEPLKTVVERAIRAYLASSAPPIETRNEEAGFVEFINEDVPFIVREIDGRCAILLDMETRRVIGYRIYDPASSAPVSEQLAVGREIMDRHDGALKALASAPVSEGEALTVDTLAQEIRRVDGDNSHGAGALAEALMPFLTAASAIRAPQGVVAEVKNQLVLLHSLANDTTEANWGDKRLYILQTCVRMGDEIAALEAALATPAPSLGEAEPVAYLHETEWGDRSLSFDVARNHHQWSSAPLYAHPSPSGVNAAPADEDAALANFERFEGSFFATQKAAMNAEVVAALRAAKLDIEAWLTAMDMGDDNTSLATSEEVLKQIDAALSALAQAAASGAGEWRDAVTDQTLEPTVKAMMAEHRAIKREIARLRSHYQSGSMLDAGRRQILDHFGAILQTGKKA